MPRPFFIMAEEKVVIASMWEFGWNAPLQEAPLWELTKREFLVDDWIMSPVTGIKNKWLRETPSIKEAIDLHPDCKVVFVSEAEGGTDLESFVHPEKAIYIFSKCCYDPVVNHKKDGDLVVKIKTPANTGLLLSSSCVSVILYDRIRKNGFNNCR